MGLPRSVTNVDRTGRVRFTSSVDRVNYTMNELSRGALRDVAKMLRKKIIIKLKQLPGMKRSRRVYRATQTWVKRREAKLEIGFGNSKKGLSGDTWYSVKQELGTKGQPKRQILRNTVFENINEIRKIQAQYISAIEDEQRALGLIDENESLGGDGEND